MNEEVVKTETVEVPCYQVITGDGLSDEFFARAQMLYQQYGSNVDLLGAIIEGLSITLAKVLVLYTANPMEVSQAAVQNTLTQRIKYYVENMAIKSEEK